MPVFVILPNVSEFSGLQDMYKYDADRLAVEVVCMARINESYLRY